MNPRNFVPVLLSQLAFQGKGEDVGDSAAEQKLKTQWSHHGLQRNLCFGRSGLVKAQPPRDCAMDHTKSTLEALDDSFSADTDRTSTKSETETISTNAHALPNLDFPVITLDAEDQLTLLAET